MHMQVVDSIKPRCEIFTSWEYLPLREEPFLDIRTSSIAVRHQLWYVWRWEGTTYCSFTPRTHKIGIASVLRLPPTRRYSSGERSHPGALATGIFAGFLWCGNRLRQGTRTHLERGTGKGPWVVTALWPGRWRWKLGVKRSWEFLLIWFLLAFLFKHDLLKERKGRSGVFLGRDGFVFLVSLTILRRFVTRSVIAM